MQVEQKKYVNLIANLENTLAHLLDTEVTSPRGQRNSYSNILRHRDLR